MVNETPNVHSFLRATASCISLEINGEQLALGITEITRPLLFRIYLEYVKRKF